MTIKTKLQPAQHTGQRTEPREDALQLEGKNTVIWTLSIIATFDIGSHVLIVIFFVEQIHHEGTCDSCTRCFHWCVFSASAAPWIHNKHRTSLFCQTSVLKLLFHPQAATPTSCGVSLPRAIWTRWKMLFGTMSLKWRSQPRSPWNRLDNLSWDRKWSKSH